MYLSFKSLSEDHLAQSKDSLIQNLRGKKESNAIDEKIRLLTNLFYSFFGLLACIEDWDAIEDFYFNKTVCFKKINFQYAFFSRGDMA